MTITRKQLDASPNQPTTIQETIYQAIGAAGVHAPFGPDTGVFDDASACAIAEWANDHITRLLADLGPAKDQAVVEPGPWLRTPNEILAHIREIPDHSDFFGALRGDLIGFLPYDLAKDWLKPEATADDWIPKAPTADVIRSEIEGYLPFAWEKANDCRGLSANRSIDHMRAWLWLLNDGSLEQMEAIAYQHYGKQQLIFVSELVGFDWRSVDDGQRVT